MGLRRHRQVCSRLLPNPAGEMVNRTQWGAEIMRGGIRELLKGAVAPFRFLRAFDDALLKRRVELPQVLLCLFALEGMRDVLCNVLGPLYLSGGERIRLIVIEHKL